MHVRPPAAGRYDLKQAATTLTLENLSKRVRTLWRTAKCCRWRSVTLGEGMTPLVHAAQLAASMDCATFM